MQRPSLPGVACIRACIHVHVVQSMRLLLPTTFTPLACAHAQPCFPPQIANVLKLLMSIFDAPNALIGLFEDTKIYIKDTEGAFTQGDFPWRRSFCAWTMASPSDQVMIIEDATQDARWEIRESG